MSSLSVPKENDKKGTQSPADAVQRLMDAYGDDVLRTSYMYLKDKHKAEDAFQEVFIKVFKKYGNFRGESSEKTWLIRITVNVCKDMLKSAWFKNVLLTDRTDNEQADSGFETEIADSLDMGFDVTHTSAVENGVEVGIFPYTEKYADYMTEKLGSDVLVLEGEQAYTLQIESTEDAQNSQDNSLAILLGSVAAAAAAAVVITVFVRKAKAAKN